MAARVNTPPAERTYSLRDWNALERSFRVVASTRNPVLNHEFDDATGKLVEFWEVLESWKLGRFIKNNLVLLHHDDTSFANIIGKGTDVAEDEQGLTMKVSLVSLHANQGTAEVEAQLKEGIIRGVSVRWEYGTRTDETRNGKVVRVYRDNTLTEVSLVALPADEDGLVEADERTPEEKRRDMISTAARTLGLSRRRTDANDDVVQRFDFVSGIGKFERTQVGGLRIPARLTRTGVLTYRKGGTVVRELRLPEEVFDAESLKTLAGAPVTSLEHHTSFITAHSWKHAALGHAENIHRDGKYIGSELVINDATTVAGVENGDLHDISCGYQARREWTPGIWNGEHYDCIQRGIRYNHVALLGKGQGRAGTDVALRLDAACVELTEDIEEIIMDKQEKTLIHYDGVDREYGSKDHIAAIEKHYDTIVVDFKTKNTELQQNFDKANGKAEAAERSLKDIEDKKKDEEGKASKRFKQRMKLVRSVMRALESDDDEDEEKMDSKMDELLELSDRDLHLRVIKADQRYADFDDNGRSDDNVAGIFEGVVRSFKRSDGIDHVIDVARGAQKRASEQQHADSGVLAEARKRKAEREKTAGMGKLTISRD